MFPFFMCFPDIPHIHFFHLVLSISSTVVLAKLGFVFISLVASVALSHLDRNSHAYLLLHITKSTVNPLYNSAGTLEREFLDNLACEDLTLYIPILWRCLEVLCFNLIGLKERHREKSLLLDPFLLEGVCNESLFSLPLNLNSCAWTLA